jgi:hypothetical protein
MKKVEEIKRPLKKGEIYLVPCLVKKEITPTDEQSLWLDIKTDNAIKIHILPIINHPHNDKENGQPETHYHLDYRFIKHKNNHNFPTIINKHSKHIFGSQVRPLPNFGELYYYPLPVINEHFSGVTGYELIRNSKLKHKCIHKGKCPHRGYDLSQVKPNEKGVITCPLHGLEFNSNKELITFN